MKQLIFLGFLGAVPGAVGAEEDINYFGSGWPIHLVDASCGDDEGCQTELANCPPGTDGTCTAQIANCWELGHDKIRFAGVCTVRIDYDGKTFALRKPDGEFAEFTKYGSEILAAIRGETATPVCLNDENGASHCFDTLTDPDTFADWAEGRMH